MGGLAWPAAQRTARTSDARLGRAGARSDGAAAVALLEAAEVGEGDGAAVVLAEAGARSPAGSGAAGGGGRRGERRGARPGGAARARADTPGAAGPAAGAPRAGHLPAVRSRRLEKSRPGEAGAGVGPALGRGPGLGVVLVVGTDDAEVLLLVERVRLRLRPGFGRGHGPAPARVIGAAAGAPVDAGSQVTVPPSSPATAMAAMSVDHVVVPRRRPPGAEAQRAAVVAVGDGLQLAPDHHADAADLGSGEHEGRGGGDPAGGEHLEDAVDRRPLGHGVAHPGEHPGVGVDRHAHEQSFDAPDVQARAHGGDGGTGKRAIGTRPQLVTG